MGRLLMPGRIARICFVTPYYRGQAGLLLEGLAERWRGATRRRLKSNNSNLDVAAVLFDDENEPRRTVRRPVSCH